jgi:hypothetical protein
MKRLGAFRFYHNLLFKSNFENEEYALASQCLLRGMTYRLPADSHHDRLVGFKSIFRVLKRRADSELTPFSSSSQVMALTGSVKSMTIRNDYLQSFGVDNAAVVAKSQLVGHWRLLSSSVLILNFGYALLQGIWCLISAKNRVQRALVLYEIIEAELLIEIIGKKGYTSFHDFAQFEIDSNAFYLFLKSRHPNVSVSKYPSPGPLSLHNSIMLTDVLCYNGPYHLDELKNLPNIRRKEMKQVPPEGYLEYVKRYRTEGLKTDARSIGYYSHGSWKRKERGDADDGLKIFENEQSLLNLISQLLIADEAISLKIFLHPIEHSSEFSIPAFYDQFNFGSERVTYSTPDLRSVDAFHTVRIGIGVYSTILFERLFAGFPTLFFTQDPNFPIRNSSLEKIALSKIGTETIQSMLRLSRGDFFEKFNLTGFVDETIRKEHLS